MKQRMTDLLTAAVSAMEDGRDPFHESFLIEHAVTLDECYDMSDAIATAVAAWLVLSEDERMVLSMRRHAGQKIADIFGAAIGMQRVTKALAEGVR